jgi:type I restriction enzyme S subunit
LTPDSLEILNWGTPDEVSATKLRFYVGDVVYGRRRAYQRKLGIARFDGICSAHALVLRARKNECLPEFLPYFLHSDLFHNRALEISVGSLSPTINWSTLKIQKFELPSIEEQQRIVEMMTSVDEHIESLRHQLDVLQTTRKSVLHHLLNAGGEGWTESTLGQVSSFVKAKAKPNLVVPELPFVGLEHLDTRSREISRTGSIREVLSLVTPFEPGDTLFGKLRPNLHKVCFASFPGVCSTELLAIRANESCSPEFLYLVCSSDHVNAFCVDRSAGTRMPRVGPSELASFSFLLPPHDEQKRIVDEVFKVDALTQGTNSALSATQQLRSALLNKEIS